MAEKKSYFYSLWFSVVMAVVSLVMLADYTHLVLTTDDSTRRIVVLVLWAIIALGWLITALVRWRAKKAG